MRAYDTRFHLYLSCIASNAAPTDMCCLQCSSRKTWGKMHLTALHGTAFLWNVTTTPFLYTYTSVPCALQ